MKTKRYAQNGFTLIEVIVTLIIASILGTIVYVFFGSGLTQSATPIIRLEKALELQKVMENINFYFENGKDLADLKTQIGVEGTEPNNSFGRYKVNRNRYIKFVGGSEDDDSAGTGDNDILKVTIEASSGEKMTMLFTVAIP